MTALCCRLCRVTFPSTSNWMESSTATMVESALDSLRIIASYVPSATAEDK